MQHLKEKIEREAARRYPLSGRPGPDIVLDHYQMKFISGANFALEMALKELESKRTEVIQINGLRTDVVAWSDIEALLGKFNTGF